MFGNNIGSTGGFTRQKSDVIGLAAVAAKLNSTGSGVGMGASAPLLTAVDAAALALEVSSTAGGLSGVIADPTAFVAAVALQNLDLTGNEVTDVGVEFLIWFEPAWASFEHVWEQLTAQFVWSDGAEAATVDGGRYTLKVVCHGACAGEAPTRSLELVHQGGKWLVDTFADVLEPVVQPLCCFAHRLHFVLG
jgi:hypothetical protein